MSFTNLNKDELADVADFFLKDVVAAKEGEPTKKELLAAIASGDPESETDGPVSWEQYNEVYLPAKTRVVPGTAAPVVQPTELGLAPAGEEDTSGYQLVKMERNNPAYEVYGYLFTKKHPFHSVPPETAWRLIKEQDGFRLALPDEITDYYN